MRQILTMIFHLKIPDCWKIPLSIILQNLIIQERLLNMMLRLKEI